MTKYSWQTNAGMHPHKPHWWYLDPIFDNVIALSARTAQLMEEWSSRELIICERLLKKITALGATSEYYYGKIEKFASVPCRAVFKDGRNLEQCIIFLSNRSPLYYLNFKQILFIDELKNITHSDFALKKEVRLAASMAEERGMGFSPLEVISKANKKFILNGSMDFFNYKGIKGKDISLSPINICDIKNIKRIKDKEKGRLVFLNGPKKLKKCKNLRGKCIVVLPPDQYKDIIVINKNNKNTIAVIGDWDQRVEKALINENSITYKLMYRPDGKLNNKKNNTFSKALGK